jgi:transposase-like protein
MRGIKKALIERALQAELSHHLGYAEGEDKPESSANQRNGTSGKTVLTDDGPLRIDIPRDRAGQFEPQLIGKHERRFTGFDDKIVAMYAREAEAMGFTNAASAPLVRSSYHADMQARGAGVA